ncbi:hypothetical protein [Streptomyces exfoliatus]|uniref:hypothetical protein n=1 Tax=Streptomyces exfoliatus TaxID=1905 RepID=UPI003793A151
MPPRKIQDEQEAIRWLEEGRTYTWIVERYKEKYGIETTVPMWSTFRRRRGIERRVVRDTELIPWKVAPEHMLEYPLVMLRAEARKRSNGEIKGHLAPRLRNWLAMLEETDQVVYYDRDTKDGFFYVPREESDTDIIRRPSSGLRSQTDE